MATSHSTVRTSGRLKGAAGVAAVEIKMTVKPEEELRALRTFELDEETAEVRVVYFYDTPKLDLFTGGIALRARLVKGDTDDSTVKVRPVDPGKVSEAWRHTTGFKVEADATGPKIIRSASLTVNQKPADIEGVAAKEKPIYTLFDRDQVRFLAEFSNKPVDFEKLKVLGPIRVLRWKTKHEKFHHALTVEEWRLPNGNDLVEVSIKVQPEESVEAKKQFEAHLTKIGLDPKGAQQTKTLTALQYFASQLGKGKKK